MTIRHAVLLINLGSPKSTSTADVRTYLRQFLMDKYVIDLPWLLRALIVYGIILPTRPTKTAAAYRKIWADGSPLVTTSIAQQQLLQDKVDIPVGVAMRYGSPSIESAIKGLINDNPLLSSIHVIPLYPHYAMSTTLTVQKEVNRVIQKTKHTIKLSFQPPFYNNVHYLNAVAAIIKPQILDLDYVLFSYHGLPYRHLKKTDPTRRHCVTKECCKYPSKAWDTCYQYQTIVTTRELAKSLSLSESQYMISYQSRLGRDPWILPNTEDVIQKLAADGIKKLGIVCPSFVTDCLETLEEINMGGRALFLENGGESFTYIPCLNTDASWISLLQRWAEDSLTI